MTSFPTPPQLAHVDDDDFGGRGRAAGIEIQTARLILLDPDRFAAAPALQGLADRAIAAHGEFPAGRAVRSL